MLQQQFRTKKLFPTVPLKMKIWNDIPLSVRYSPSLDSFKRNLKIHYITNNWPPGDYLHCLWFDILNIVRSTNCYEWMNESGTVLVYNRFIEPTP